MDGLIMRRGWLVAWRDVTTNAPLPKSRPGIISIPGFSNPWVYKALTNTHKLLTNIVSFDKNAINKQNMCLLSTKTNVSAASLHP